MTVSGVAPIHAALTHALRHDPTGPASFPFENSKWLHEGFAPEKVPYPFVTATPFSVTDVTLETRGAFRKISQPPPS